MKKIKIFSDVVFDLITKNLENQGYVLDYNYSDNIVSKIISEKNYINDFDFLLIHFDSNFHRYNDEMLRNIINAIIEVSNNFHGNILVCNNFISYNETLPQNESLGESINFILKHENIIKTIKDKSNVYLYDFNKLFSHLGFHKAYNFNTGYLYQMPYSKEFINLISLEIFSYLEFIIKSEKKVILLDCDNTLWKGIIGEDSINGVKCNKNHDGVLFFYFQQFLLSKKKEGFLLCLCSKNNERDVNEAFEKLNMPLKLDDFIVRKINWKNKADNIKTISKELNLGTESFIFVDDSDFEIELINKILPEIKTFKFENNIQNFIDITNNFSFKKKFISQEDTFKTEQYNVELKRKELQNNLSSFEDYIKSLEIDIKIFENDLKDINRLSQLTEKTNQFNFNKEYFSPKQLEKFINDGNIVFSLKVKDKFSDYGTVGVMLIEFQNNNVNLRNFLMSCRVIGRNIEYDFFKNVKEVLNKRYLRINKIVFNETKKNEPAKTFYLKIKNNG